MVDERLGLLIEAAVVRRALVVDGRRTVGVRRHTQVLVDDCGTGHSRSVEKSVLIGQLKKSIKNKKIQ